MSGERAAQGITSAVASALAALPEGTLVAIRFSGNWDLKGGCGGGAGGVAGVGGWGGGGGP